MFFYFNIRLFSGFLQFQSNFVPGQNNSKYLEWSLAPSITEVNFSFSFKIPRKMLKMFLKIPLRLVFGRQNLPPGWLILKESVFNNQRPRRMTKKTLHRKWMLEKQKWSQRKRKLPWSQQKLLNNRRTTENEAPLWLLEVNLWILKMFLVSMRHGYCRCQVMVLKPESKKSTRRNQKWVSVKRSQRISTYQKLRM